MRRIDSEREKNMPQVSSRKAIDRPCPISGSREYEVVGHVKDNLISKQQFPLLRNLLSGLLITGEAPPESELGQYYQSEEYISHSDSHKGLINIIYQLARRITLPAKQRIIKKYLPGTPACQTILDVGCGTGHFAGMLRKKWYNVLTVEQSETARRYAKENFGLVSFTSLTEVDIAPLSVDLITLWHVLEHIDNLPEHFVCFRRLLKSSGILMLALPNHSGFDARYYGEQWAAYDAPRHLWHFTPETIASLARKEGFELIEKKPMRLDAYYISILTEQQRGRSKACAISKAIWIGTCGLIRSLFKSSEASSLIYFFRRL